VRSTWWPKRLVQQPKESSASRREVSIGALIERSRGLGNGVGESRIEGDEARIVRLTRAEEHLAFATAGVGDLHGLERKTPFHS